MFILLLLILSTCGVKVASVPEFLLRWVTRENVQFTPNRSYSTHECFNTGGDGKLGERVLCLLHNVCYNPQRKAAALIDYYEDVDVLTDIGMPAPKHFDNGTLGEFPPFHFCGEVRQLVASTRAPFPARPTWLSPAVVALACPLHCAWFSHQWLDNVIPYFWAAQVAGTYDPEDFGLLWLLPRQKTGHKTSCTKCKPFFRDWLWPSGLVSPTAVCDIRDVSSTVCFHNLIVGGAAFGYYQFETPGADDTFSGLRPAFVAVRDFVRYGLAGLSPNDGPAAQHILVVRKKGKRRILNTDHLVARLQVCFPGVGVSASFVGDLPPVDQVRTVNRATVIVSPSGTVSYSTLFAAPHTVLIQVDRFQPSKNRTFGSDQYVYMNSGVRFMAYPVRPSEIRLDFPKGYSWARRTSPDFKHHSFGLVHVDTWRMAQLVFWGLRSAREMRNGDPRFGFSMDGLRSGRCRAWREPRPGGPAPNAIRTPGGNGTAAPPSTPSNFIDGLQSPDSPPRNATPEPLSRHGPSSEEPAQ